MKLRLEGGRGRQRLSNSREWLVGAVLLGIGFASTITVWAQSSETRFGFLRKIPASRSPNLGYDVYSSTAFPPVNTYGFKHAEVAVERGARVALVNTRTPNLPSTSGRGISVPPPSLMVVSGLPANSANSANSGHRITSAETEPRRSLFARRTQRFQANDEGSYMHSKPSNSTALIRSSSSAAANGSTQKRLGLRNLFRRRN